MIQIFIFFETPLTTNYQALWRDKKPITRYKRGVELLSCVVTMFHELSCSFFFSSFLVFVMKHHASIVVFLGHCHQYVGSPTLCPEKFICDSPGKLRMC